MGEIAIRAEDLGKSYRIGHKGVPGHRTLRESLVSRLGPRSRRTVDRSHETVWALRDVSFEVQRGEAVGIIGRNGAGKSTLLKVLSRITRPTTGRAEVYGRLGSLLEVGTGFHPELTGRENVFLNGAILGMRRREIQRRFDEIVDFAETERFLDTPVKRYSTGMYLRLAFAVAAHLQTDILVVDEVLAVGDAAFQAKCLGKMENVTTQGRTVLFVSHNLAAVTQLCTRALLIDAGRIRAEGSPDEVISRYVGSANEAGRADLNDRVRPTGSGSAVFEWAEVRNRNDEACQAFSIGDDVRVSVGLRFAPARRVARLLLSIRTADGLPVALISTDDTEFVVENGTESRNISVDFEDIRLYPGRYNITLWATDSTDTEEYDRAEDCLVFRIVDGGTLTSRSLPRHAGIVFLTPRWSGGSGALPPQSIVPPRNLHAPR